MYELQINLNICRQTLAAIPADILEQVKAEAENYEVIGIDEGQFVSWNNLEGSKLYCKLILFWVQIISNDRTVQQRCINNYIIIFFFTF